MANAQEMAAYTLRLQGHTSAQSKPVTEICIFKLRDHFVSDHASAATQFETQIIDNTRPGGVHSLGIRKCAWGFSVDDPSTLVWMLDWDMIQSHWAFWQSPGFPPVMEAISNLFVPGRPLVRHFDFGEEGMLGSECEFARVLVWDDGPKGKSEFRARTVIGASSKCKDAREAYAVDLDEMTWWCSLFGYSGVADARADSVNEVPEAGSHVVKLKYQEV